MLAAPVPSNGTTRVVSPRGSQALREADLFRSPGPGDFVMWACADWEPAELWNCQLFENSWMELLPSLRQQRARLLADARRAGNAVEAADIALIFALDRTDFALQQLRSFKGSEALPLDTPLQLHLHRARTRLCCVCA
eukprot:s1756_g2.t1